MQKKTKKFTELEIGELTYLSKDLKKVAKRIDELLIKQALEEYDRKF